MRILKMACMAFMACFALGVTAVSASAEELPLLLPSPVTGTATAGVGTLSLEGTTIECAKGASTFGAESDTLGTFAIKFEECKNGGKGCISLGQTAGSRIIETAGTFHLVRLPLSKTHFFVWFLFSPTDGANAIHLECEVAGLILTWGSLLGLILVVSELTWKLDVEREGTGSTIKQKAGQTEFVNNNGETVHVTGLRGKLGTGAERAGGEESAGNLIHWNTDVTIMLP
jgi:hypothetical protein